MSTDLPQKRLQELADTLWHAWETRTPCPPLVESEPKLSVRDAYAIQRINIRRRQLAGGDGRQHLVGHKIGLTSHAIQRWLNVDEPDFGCLLESMAVPQDGIVDTSTLLQPRAEGEVAFVLGKDLSGPGVTSVDVIDATAYVLPAIEIVDSRVADWKITIADTVADNASAGCFVLGTRPTKLEDVDLSLAGMRLSKNGRVVSTGAGVACLDSPLHAVAWLANTFGRFGTSLRAGEVILSGALGPVTAVQAGDELVLDIAHLGRARVRFAAPGDPE